MTGKCVHLFFHLFVSILPYSRKNIRLKTKCVNGLFNESFK